MPLDFTFIGRAFEENPDPEKLKKVLAEIHETFIKDVAQYIDENNQLKIRNTDANSGINPTLIITLRIAKLTSQLKEMGWPQAYDKMLDEFTSDLFRYVGIYKVKC